jgi:iron(III) transport system ATP-binding protein
VSAAIELRGVEVAVQGVRLIGPVDLEVEEGEHLLLAGRSGCGKTTLLRAVAGLARPWAGRVALFGQTASEGARVALAPEKRRIGFLFQGGALWPHMSARKTLEFVLKVSGADADPRTRVPELLEQVELPGYEERMPGTLSGGEAQRLALARALAANPRLLLLDEPLGPLDAELRGALIERLGRLQRELGLTVVHVTHDPDEARAIATRTVRMADGRLEEGS